MTFLMTLILKHIYYTVFQPQHGEYYRLQWRGITARSDRKTGDQEVCQGDESDLRLLVLELMRPVLFTSKKKQTMEKQTM